MPDTPPGMTSHRPYLLRALYEWIADNGMTPHILVDAAYAGVRVPAHTIKDGRVVLNIADRVVVQLQPGHGAVGDVEHHPAVHDGVRGHAHAGLRGIHQDVRGHAVVGDPLVQRPQQVRAMAGHGGG